MGLVMVGTGAPGVLGDMMEVGTAGMRMLLAEPYPALHPHPHSMHGKHSMRKSSEDWPWALPW